MKLAVAALVAAGGALLAVSPVGAQDPGGGRIDAKAREALAAMSQALAAAPGLRFTAEGTFERIAADGQKIQHATSLLVSLDRDRGLRALIARDDGRRTVWFDGKTATLNDPELGQYEQRAIASPGGSERATAVSAEAMLDATRAWFADQSPLLPLLAAKPIDRLTAAVETGRHVGLHTTDGVRCHHLAFTQSSVDWQLWIDAEDEPLPRRLVVTYKGLPGAPQYQVDLDGWKTAVEIPEGGFEPPEGARRVDALPAWPGVGKDGR